jgi:hypothetical protein
MQYGKADFWLQLANPCYRDNFKLKFVFIYWTLCYPFTDSSNLNCFENNRAIALRFNVTDFDYNCTQLVSGLLAHSFMALNIRTPSHTCRPEGALAVFNQSIKLVRKFDTLLSLICNLLGLETKFRLPLTSG